MYIPEMASFDTAWYNTRIAATQALIEAYEAAVLALAIDGVQSYTLNTGQSTQTVTKASIPGMNAAIDVLVNRLTIYEARKNGTGTVIGVPGW